MKNRKRILINIIRRRFRNKIRRKKNKKKNRKKEFIAYSNFCKKIGGKPNPFLICSHFFSDSVKYILYADNSPLNLTQLRYVKDDYHSIIDIPLNFSLSENPSGSYLAIKQIMASFLFHKSKEIIIDYTRCSRFTLDAQILLDLILKDILLCNKIYGKYKRTKKFRHDITDRTVNNSRLRKMLFSVGSQAIHVNNKKDFPDVIPYNLCIHHSLSDALAQIEQKDIDTTTLSDYVEECLKRMDRKLDANSMDDLCTVIGEILINAEEHSSTQCRYSIGYFEQKEIEGKSVGVFQLVIMNLGRTIYEKFHDEDCPNKSMVVKMKALSDRYTKRNLWKWKTFDEESLWTLYSLQDGVTSVSPSKYIRRGNGSCRFIESFFNLRNSDIATEQSKMTLQSGRTRIIFDGRYSINETEVKGDMYKVMTFNDSGSIEDKPDTNYVKTTDFYFPGTFICANIIF